MEYILQALSLLFGNDPELRQIIGVTLQMSFISTTISSLLGLPLGILIGSSDFRGKKWVQRINNTLMGLPPVVAGLMVLLILSRSGPLGKWKLLYTVTAMVVAQVFLITPHHHRPDRQPGFAARSADLRDSRRYRPLPFQTHALHRV